ncbi:MAG: hypothetical protein KDB65_04105 [Calditrichaeota bacterium]|nr:hypothetical protein [Calditrichota bacterium]MCB9368846.1 hypothetical protein [Calditrichota bacterium]
MKKIPTSDKILTVKGDLNQVRNLRQTLCNGLQLAWLISTATLHFVRLTYADARPVPGTSIAQSMNVPA